MAERFTPGPGMRFANAAMTGMVKLGLSVGANTIITVPGRKSGLAHSTPITMIRYGGRRYVQSPFGEANWIRNLRAAGKATLRSGRRMEQVTVRELSAEEKAPIYQAILPRAPKFVRNQFDVAPGAPLEEFERVAKNHPMFEVQA